VICNRKRAKLVELTEILKNQCPTIFAMQKVSIKLTFENLCLEHDAREVDRVDRSLAKILKSQ
jgi:hypothetical protein